MPKNTLTRAAMVVAAGMLLSRLSGFVREISLAGVLGLSRDADLAVLAISIPDLLTAMLVGGAAGAVLIPEIHRLGRSEGPSAANELFSQSLAGAAMLGVAIAGVLALAAPLVVSLLAPGFSGADRGEAVRLVRIVMLALPLCPLAAITSAALQSRGRVALTAVGTLIFNAVLIAAIVALLARSGVVALAWAVVAAAALRFASQLIACARGGMFAGGMTRLVRLTRLRGDLPGRYLMALGAIGLTVAIPVIARAMASGDAGSMAAFTYAFKLVELPRGLIVAVLTMVLFPRLSRLFDEGRAGEGERLIARGTNLILLFTLPVAICFAACAGPVVSLLFERGAVGAGEAARIAMLARVAFVSLPALGLVTIAMNVFHAHRHTRFPLLATLAVAAVHVAVSAAVVRPWGDVGLMVTVSAVCWLHCLLLCGGLWWRYRISIFGGMVMRKSVRLEAGKVTQP